MRLRAYPSIAVAATALAVAAPSALAAPPTPHQLTLSAQPSTVVFGKSTTLSGKLTGANSGGETIVVRDDPFPFDHFSPFGTTTTAADGTYKLPASPTVNTKYQADAKSKAPATSAEVLVKVAPRVTLNVSDLTPAAGQTVVFKGRVYPPHDGQNVVLQRRNGDGTWKTLVKVPLTDAGDTYSFYKRSRKITRSGTFRVVKFADADHTRGQSPRRKLAVHQ